MKNNKLSKSFSRYGAIQALYNLNFTEDFGQIKRNFSENEDCFLYVDFKNKLNERKFNRGYLLKILNTYEDKRLTINELIQKNLYENWNIERLPKVLLSIVRVAVAEMLVSPRISIGIIVSEYLIFTESFFTDKECSFINAILEKIFLELKENEQRTTNN